MTQEYTPGAHHGAAEDSPLREAAFGDTSPSHSGDSDYSGATDRADSAPFAAGMETDVSDSKGPARKRSRSRGRRRPKAEDANESQNSDSQEEKEAKPAASKRPRRRKKAPAAAAESETQNSDSEDEAPARKSRSRRAKRGSRKKTETAEVEAPQKSEAPSDSDDSEEPKRKSRRRGGRGRRKKTGTTEPAAEVEAEANEEDGGDEGEKKKTSSRRRGKRGGRRRSRSRGSEDAVAFDVIPGEIDDLPELPDLPEETEVLETPARRTKRKTKRKTTKKASGKKNEAEVAEDEEPEKRTGMILVNALDHDEQRVAVVEDGRIMDFDMTVETKRSHVGDIYRGRVVNLEPAIGAAFVDFGRGRNGFLHTSDVLSAYGEKDWNLEKLLTTQVDPDEWESEDDDSHVGDEIHEEEETSNESLEKKDKDKDKRKGGGRKPKFRARQRLPITDLLKKGQQVVVQVTKDAIGDKGPTLTTYISIPGRYLVLMPSMARKGVSRKIEDDKERRRLKRIVDTLKSPDGMGVIVRTAGVGRTKIALKRDLEYLLGVWDSFGRCLRIGSGPAALYQESDVAIRTMRDLYSSNIEAVMVDDEKVHKNIVEFAETLMPEAVERVKLHEGARPLFHAHGVEQDYEKIFTRRVELPSGGSIVLDQTEALVAIDVNSGRTRSSGFDFEAIALKTNMEAVPEIARQIRLRDLGGIIVVDFIDMMKRPNGRAVEKAFRDEIARDRARSKLGRISQFGLLEMTRQRLGPGLDKKVFTTCTRCRGTARIRTVESRASAILRRLGSALTLKGFSRVEVRAHPEVVAYLKKDCKVELERLEDRHQRELTFTAVKDQPEDSVLRYLRADGREVRPGGRRKN